MTPAQVKKDDFYLSSESVKEPDVNPKELFGFAKWVLGVVTALSIGAVAVYLEYPGSKETANVYELAKTILPPIATLILGFYFGGKK